MFRVKICGVTTPEDGRIAADAGADAIGLNFYSRSKRCVSPETAREIIAALPASMIKVGVFVNMPAHEIAAIAGPLQLDLIQLHGDETPEQMRDVALGDIGVMRAFRCGDTLQPVADYLTRAASLGAVPRMILFDGRDAQAYGGTGVQADWALASDAVKQFQIPLVLAGGLEPENVAAAIRIVRPAAVDVASGVEKKGRRKSPLLVEAFVDEALRAFAALAS